MTPFEFQVTGFIKLAPLTPQLTLPGVRQPTFRCPRQWGVDRTGSELGYCRMPGWLRAERLSGARDYFSVAAAAIREMVRQTGPCVVENGLLKRGTLIRHLVLPGQVGNSLDVLEWIGKTFAPGTVMVSLMSQYVPYGRAVKMPPFDRRVSAGEYAAVESWLPLCGLREGFVQDSSSASLEYLPSFDLEEIQDGKTNV